MNNSKEVKEEHLLFVDLCLSDYNKNQIIDKSYNWDTIEFVINNAISFSSNPNVISKKIKELINKSIGENRNTFKDKISDL